MATPLMSTPLRENSSHPGCVSEFLDRWVEEGGGGEPCLIYPDGTLTYAQLQGQVNSICIALVGRLDFVPGNRVLLRSENNPMMVALHLAVLEAGDIVVATTPVRVKEMVYRIAKAKISLVFCDFYLSSKMERAK
jgi:2-aminobenzoate-CoA ligase